MGSEWRGVSRWMWGGRGRWKAVAVVMSVVVRVVSSFMVGLYDLMDGR